MRIEDVPLNTAVFSTRFVSDEDSPILYVTHDLDGDWQFMGDDDITDEDAKIVSLKNILDLDNSLTSLPPLEEGFRAVREKKGGLWQVYEISQ